MHATFEQLINLAGQAPVDVAVMSHVDQCEQCSAQLHELRERQRALRELPLLNPSPAVFEQLQKRLNSPTPPVTHRRKHMALAAALVLGIVGLNLVSGSIDSSLDAARSQPPLVDSATQELDAEMRSGDSEQVASTPSLSPGTTRVLATEQDVDQLIQRAATLQRVLKQLNALESGSTSVVTQEAIEALEARLAVLNYGLAAPGVDASDPQIQRDMLQRRVSTLQSMVGVQHAELARQGYHGFRVIPAGNMSPNMEQEITW